MVLDIIIQFAIKHKENFMALELKVPTMACSACADIITKAVKKVDPTAEVQADTKTKIVNIQTQQPETEIRAVIAQAGYPVG